MYYHGPRGRGVRGRGHRQNPNNNGGRGFGNGESGLSSGGGGGGGGGIIRSLEMVEAAVATAKNDILAAGGSVSTWKVTQSAAMALQVWSWDSLGVRLHDVPTLRNLQFVEGKVNAFIHCFVSTRRMTSVHELGTELCNSEGVEQFDELGLGPLLRHPLIQHYFSIPPDAMEVFKITVEEMIARLTVFQYKMKYKEFTVEEFLDFLVQKYSVTSRELLGVRIQSMGMYIKFIRKIKKAEDVARKSIQESGLPREEPERPSDSIHEHIRSIIDDSEEINHRTTDTRKDDSDGNGADCCASRCRKRKKCQSCKAHNSADVHEFKLIGLKLAMFNYRNCGQESTENEDLKHDRRARYEITQTNPVRATKLFLTNDELERFIATWKGACQKHTVGEVLAMMLHIYETSDKKRRKMERLFLSFPAVGLLNIAVRSIKFGELDCNNQNPKENILPNPVCKTNMEVVCEPPSNEEDGASVAEKCTQKVDNNTSTDDIIKHVANYFGFGHLMPGKDRAVEERAVIHDCEIWLSKRLFVNGFKCLGHGCFIEFLERNVSLLPREIQYLMTTDTGPKSSLEVSMLQQQFLTFLFQAARALGDSTVMTGQYISILLRKQFPSMTFQLTKNGLERNFLDLFKNQEDFDIPSSVTFSVALSMTQNASSLQKEDFRLEPFEMQYASVGTFGSVSASDAIKCLLRVPMLSDLQSWSHWDIIFAPSLGPLLEWLLSMGCIKELSCIVTCEGKIIRIDDSATLDEFLEALVLGSSFQTAVKLLSLFNMYGGSHNIPVALLKCYCQRAFDVTIQNYTDKSNTYAWRGSHVQHNFLPGHFPGAIDGSTLLFDSHCVGAELQLVSRLPEGISEINKAHAVIAKFVLECLCHLPSEFRSTAADILVSSLQLLTKDAALVMLHICKTTNERIMLHDIGLSLGIIEWVHDYQEFSSPSASDILSSSETISRQSELVTVLKSMPNTYNLFPTDDNRSAQTIHNADSTNSDSQAKEFCEVAQTIHGIKESSSTSDYCIDSFRSKSHEVDDSIVLIQKIRHEEFGLDPNLENAEISLITKQHARLGRALHCLSQELYSQDSHFILELVQNADDNTYPENVEPTLVFILQEAGIVVLNNEQGFSAENIRALCDVGSSTKKGSDAGYIGKKGIGFKSVFRVSDAPEIHSNNFHVKFDITEGHIGFVLPTLISPCNIDFYKEQIFGDSGQSCATSWNTCIVLPFNSKIKKDTGMGPVVSMFSDLHPSLLLFLQRLQCITFKNMLDNKLITMRRESLKNGILRVSHGNVSICWLVVDKNLQASFVRPDVQSTKISIAFTLHDSDNGGYTPCLDQQPVFSFLPLRNYGLKFILQGDFVLPSSREEVDGGSAWNQWLLLEFPDLFVSAEKSFCMLPCFQKRPGKAVTAFMSFVPLMGEVHGFFSQLPHMILSKLRLSNCLLLDGSNVVWVRPCKVLRNWNEEVRKFIPDTLLQQQFGLGYLCKDIILPDSLAKALGIQEYGPKFLIDLLSSICHSSDGIKSLGLYWLSSWLNALYTSLNSLAVHSLGCLSSAIVGSESELLNCLRQISFIPLSDGSYGSLAKGPIWLPFDVLSLKHEGESGLKHFTGLYTGLRTVDPLLFLTEATINGNLEETRDNLIRMLCKIGVQKLSAHDVIRNHILPSLSVGKIKSEDDNLMIEYLSFIMIHRLSTCVNCNAERDDIILELRKKPVILTNHGYKCAIEEPIHFSKEFGNSIDLHKLLRNTDIKWNETKANYLKHSSMLSVLNRRAKWREFFQELGVTDFVQVTFVDRNVLGVLNSGVERISSTGDLLPSELFVKDWESAELNLLLCEVSSNKSLDKSKYLLEILDKMWDDCYSPKAKCYIPFESKEEILDSSFMKTLHKFKWVGSSIDEDVHYPKDLFYDCESVHSILGVLAPYAVPKVTSKLFLEDIQFKVQVTLDDALRVIRYWRDSELSASISQISKLYTFIRDELSLSNEKITEVRTSISIFVPLVYTTEHMDVLPGKFMPPDKVYWHDPTGCLDRLKEKYDEHSSASEIDPPSCMTVANLYPGLRDFLVTDCGVLETLPFRPYLQILLQLSKTNLPSQAAHEVFHVLVKWADDLESGFMNAGEVLDLKESLLKLESTVLPTVQGKWVSLHPRFGLVCWSVDDELMEQCMHLNGVYFLHFGDLTVLEKEKLSSKVATLMQNIGVRTVTEVVSREAIFYGISDCTLSASLISWVIPYVQRYLFVFHPDVYFHVKHCELEKLAQLRVIGVEKLFYRYYLNGHSAASTKRYECSCLLQGNIFYTTPSVDTHSMFLELARFFHGTPQLQTANFLHMIANMSKLGSTEEEIESFISSKQNVHVLPDEEPSWSSSLGTSNSSESLLPTYPPSMMSTRRYPNLGKKQFNTTNWPPTNWKTAPDFHSPSEMPLIENPGAGGDAEKMQIIASKDPGVLTYREDREIPNEIDDIYVVKDDLGTASCLTLQQSTEVGREPSVASSSEQTYHMPISTSSSIFAMRDKLCLGVPEGGQAYATGRLGEMVAYKYFSDKLGPAAEVRWVNEEAETGLPYDLIIGEGGSREYIEVKSTTSATKDWFPISTKEFHYAYEKGDSFSIAWVVVSSPTSAEISVFKNPLKHCKENALQLALIVPQGSDISIV